MEPTGWRKEAGCHRRARHTKRRQAAKWGRFKRKEMPRKMGAPRWRKRPKAEETAPASATRCNQGHPYQPTTPQGSHEDQEAQPGGGRPKEAIRRWRRAQQIGMAYHVAWRVLGA